MYSILLIKKRERDLDYPTVLAGALVLETGLEITLGSFEALDEHKFVGSTA